MEHLKLYEEYNHPFAKNVYNIDRKNRFNVNKSSYNGGYDIEYSSSLGKGKALIFDNTTTLTLGIDMKDNEMYLFGINTTPQNVGIGRMFIKDIFDYFNIDRVYLPSSKDHPVWNKIATKTDIETYNKDMCVFTLDREQLN